MITSNLAKTLRKAQEDAKLQGIEKGMEQGIKKGKIEIALKMLQKNLPIEAVVDITELPIEEVRNLAKEIYN